MEHRWIVPLNAVKLEQKELLPPAVTIVDTVYEVGVSSFGASASLANLCEVCAVLNGATAPVPAFSGALTAGGALPDKVVSVEVESGTITLQIENDLSFDPIAGGGTAILTVFGPDGGQAMAALALASPEDSLPPGRTTTRVVTIAGGAVVGGLAARLELASSGGQTVAIGADDRIRLDVATTLLRVRAVTVRVDGLSASLTPKTVDVDDLDHHLLDGVLSGKAILAVRNPFDAALTGAIDIGGILREIAVPVDPSSSMEVDFTGDELRAILSGPRLVLSGWGSVSGGPTRLTPASELVIAPTFDIVMEVGR